MPVLFQRARDCVNRCVSRPLSGTRIGASGPMPGQNANWPPHTPPSGSSGWSARLMANAARRPNAHGRVRSPPSGSPGWSARLMANAARRFSRKPESASCLVSVCRERWFANSSEWLSPSDSIRRNSEARPIAVRIGALAGGRCRARTRVSRQPCAPSGRAGWGRLAGWWRRLRAVERPVLHLDSILKGARQRTAQPFSSEQNRETQLTTGRRALHRPTLSLFCIFFALSENEEWLLCGRGRTELALPPIAIWGQPLHPSKGIREVLG